MASQKIERLAKSLSMPGLTLAQRQASMNHVLGASKHPYIGLAELHQAITLIKDEVTRADLGRHLWAQLNTPRFIYDSPLPKTASVVSAAIFTLDDASLISGSSRGDSLQLLTGPLDGPMFSIKDPLQPRIEPLILALPFALLDFERALAMNYMLGNPTRSETDDAYAEMWMAAMKASSTTLNTLAFLFLTTQEGTTFTSAARADARPATGERTHRILDMITAHADHLNREFPGLNMQMVELTSFSDAVMRGSELRIRKAFRDQKHTLGAYDKARHEISDDMFMGDALREAEESVFTGREGESEPPEETYGKAVLGLVNVPGVGQQLGQCLMMSVHDVPNIAMNVTLPQGVTSAMLAQWWREEIDPEERATVTLLPSLLVKELPRGSDKTSRYRDETGEWFDLEVLRLGKPGRALFRTATWAGAIEAEQVALESPAQLAGVPHPRLLLQMVDLEKAVRGHFQPPVAQSLLRLAAQPGLSYGWMREAMTDEHIELASCQMYLPHPTDAYMPDGFWAPLHFDKAGGVVFKVRESLQEALSGSDLKGGFPIHLLRSPYPDIYIQFAKPMPLQAEIALGAYCSDHTLTEEECALNECPAGTRVFELMVVTTHNGGLSPALLTRAFRIEPTTKVTLLRSCDPRFARRLKTTPTPVSPSVSWSPTASLSRTCSPWE